MYTDKEQLEKVLTGCKQNERVAQKELYSNYYGYAMSIALRYASNHDNAVEMVNDAFLKVFKDLKKFEPRNDNFAASFTAWFKRVVMNACIDHFRKYHKKETMANLEIEKIPISDQRQNGEGILTYKEILKCIQQLSPAYRTVFNLNIIEGFSHAEIADKLNISTGSSKSNLFKARQNLQTLFKNRNVVNHEIEMSTASV